MSYRVLVVDDNPDHRFLTRRALRSLSGELDVAASECEDGASALACLERETFDLVLLDVKMPGIDGFEVLRRLRLAPHGASLPVVMFSSSENAADHARAQELGATGFVTKPLDARAFADTVRAAVRERARERA